MLILFMVVSWFILRAIFAIDPPPKDRRPKRSARRRSPKEQVPKDRSVPTVRETSPRTEPIQSVNSTEPGAGLAGQCKLIFGPMYSGKTTHLLQELTTLADIVLNVLYINHGDDQK